MGKYDLVEQVLTEMGAEFFFTGALIQPGRPIVFGRVPCGAGAHAREGASAAENYRYFFGLPGNPISTMVTFELFSRPVIEARDRGLKRALLVLLALWIVKTVVVAFAPGYSVDVGTYEAWALQMASGGPVSMYRTGYFLDYPPGYLYALWAAGSFANAFGVSSHTALLIIVETPALVADFALAALMYVFVRRSGSERSAWIAMLFVAVNPANSNNIVGVFQQDRWNNGGARGLAAAVSLDSGQNWSMVTLPFSTCAESL